MEVPFLKSHVNLGLHPNPFQQFCHQFFGDLNFFSQN
jgi:hypothetical protein